MTFCTGMCWVQYVGFFFFFYTVRFSAAPSGIISPLWVSRHMVGRGCTPEAHTQFSSVPFWYFGDSLSQWVTWLHLCVKRGSIGVWNNSNCNHCSSYLDSHFLCNAVMDACVKMSFWAWGNSTGASFPCKSSHSTELLTRILFLFWTPSLFFYTHKKRPWGHVKTTCALLH